MVFPYLQRRAARRSPTAAQAPRCRRTRRPRRGPTLERSPRGRSQMRFYHRKPWENHRKIVFFSWDFELDLPSDYDLQFAIENGHRNSGFSKMKTGDFS